MRRAAFVLLAVPIVASIAGCPLNASRSLVSEPLPEDVEYAAFLFQGEGGSIFHTTGLMRRDPEEPIGVPLPEAIEDASLVHLYGFRGADLRALGFETRHEETPLSFAGPEEPILPSPAWYAIGRITSGQGTLERTGDPPLLSAAWLPPCAGIVAGTSRLVDSGCHHQYCDLTAEQSGCAVAITASNVACVPSRVEGRIDDRGRLRVPGCEPRTPNPGASAAIACLGIRNFECTIEIHPEAAAPQLFVQAIALFGSLEEPPPIREPVVVGGYLFGLEVFTDRIVVASDGGRAAWSGECPSGDVDGLFHFLDPDSLETIGTAASPPCVRELVRIPNREEFFGVFGPEDGRSLGRFAKDGRLLESAAIPERIGIDFPISIVVHQLTDRVSVAFDGDGLQLHTFRRTPALAHQWSSPLLGRMANHQERTEEVIALLHRDHDAIHSIDPTQPFPQERSPFFPSNAGLPIDFRQPCEDTAIRAERMLFVPQEGWLIASKNDTTGLIANLSVDGTRCAVVRWFEGPSEVFDFVLWPGDPNLVLTGIRRTDDGRAVLALMNRSEERFLTGSVDAGAGAVYHMRGDPRGRVYLTLPWTGQVARAEMR